MVTPQGVRRWIMTGAVAAITVTGALYGAGLKSDQEFKQERKRIQQTPPDEMIAQLESARAELVKKANEMQRKIDGFSARRKERQQEREQNLNEGRR